MEMMQEVTPVKCLAKTFKSRRHLVTRKIPKMSFLMQKYPQLTDFGQVRNRWKARIGNVRLEFQRVTGKDIEHFENLFVEMLTADMDLHKSCPFNCRKAESACVLPNPVSSPHELCVTEAEIRAFLCDKTNGQWQNDFVIYASSGSSANTKRMQPSINFNETVETGNSDQDFSLCHWTEAKAVFYCEQVQILSGMNLYNALLASYYLYYVFHLEYVGKVDELLWQHFDEILSNTAAKK